MTKKPASTKQLLITTSRLLKGIDNSTGAIRSHQKKIDAALPELKEALSALSVSSQTPVAAKADKKVAASKPAKADKKAPKPEKAAKAAPKAAKAAKPEKAAKAAKPEKNKADRPQLKSVVTAILTAERRVSKKALLDTVTKKHGYSRPSFSNLLKKNEALFLVDSEGFVTLATSKSNGSMEDVENLVNEVAQDQSTAQAV